MLIRHREHSVPRHRRVAGGSVERHLADVHTPHTGEHRVAVKQLGALLHHQVFAVERYELADGRLVAHRQRGLGVDAAAQSEGREEKSDSPFHVFVFYSVER